MGGFRDDGAEIDGLDLEPSFAGIGEHLAAEIGRARRRFFDLIKQSVRPGIRRQLESRKQHDPSVEAMIVETRKKVEAYAKKLDARRPKLDPVEQAKEAGLVRLGIKKSNGNGDEQIVRV